MKARTSIIILWSVVVVSLFGLLVYVANGDSIYTWNGYRHPPGVWLSVWLLLFTVPLAVGFAIALASHSRSLVLKGIQSGRKLP